VRFKYRATKPARTDLLGLSASQFKTLLKRQGFKLPRDFFKRGSVAKRGNRLYRFRWWSPVYSDGDYRTGRAFSIDRSCVIADFDRWANSTEEILLFERG
jgi:hypothetical protein